MADVHNHVLKFGIVLIVRTLRLMQLRSRHASHDQLHDVLRRQGAAPGRRLCHCETRREMMKCK